MRRWWGFIGMACVVSLAMSTAGAVEAGVTAPEIALRDQRGEVLRLASLRGRVVVIDFWASWCAPCLEELALLESMQAEYRSQGLVVVGVGRDKTRDVHAAFVNAAGLSFPVVHDPDGVVAARYAPRMMPTSYLIDRRGLVRYVHAGYQRGDDAIMRRDVARLLAEK